MLRLSVYSGSILGSLVTLGSSGSILSSESSSLIVLRIRAGSFLLDFLPFVSIFGSSVRVFEFIY